MVSEQTIVLKMLALIPLNVARASFKLIHVQCPSPKRQVQAINEKQHRVALSNFGEICGKVHCQ